MAVRAFDFPVRTPLNVALRAVTAALADDGLTTNHAPTPRITSVIVDGVKRVIVPDSRIVALVDKPAPDKVDTAGLSVDDWAIAFAKAATA